jgi:glutathione synthase/RimK-type ligase-like ATP-grasp enzyme
MKIVAQMDDIFSINIKTDTTFLMLQEAQNRGHEIFYYTPETISLDVKKQKIFAQISKIKLNNSSNFCEIIEKKEPQKETTTITKKDILQLINNKKK